MGRKGFAYLAVALATANVLPLAAKPAPLETTRTFVVTDHVLSDAPIAVATGMEDVNHEIYGGLYSQMIFGESFAEPARGGVSRQWRATDAETGAAYMLTSDAPFKDEHSQRIVRSAAGNWSGVENRGLNRQGLSLIANKSYEGTLALRVDRAMPVRISFQSEDGRTSYAVQTIRASAGGWKSYPVALTPSRGDTHARFAIEIDRAGTLDVGYAFVQPGAWGRYKALPVRGDVVQSMIDQHLQAIRFGGCANSGCGPVPDYKWKAMVGDPAHRPVTRGFWYPYESNGFGIFDFLQLGEALGIEAVPSLNIEETPADIRDLMDYLYGAPATTWGSRRVADGHPSPYKAHRFELGNEDAIDDAYYAKFKALADIIWSHDPSIKLVVGDFTYQDVIHDPYDFTGGGKVKSLAAHRKILELAARYHAEVDFDVHLWTRKPDDGGWKATHGDVASQIAALDSYAAALRKIGPAGVRFKVVVFELNANTHDMTRALANAYAITELQQRPYIDVVSSANAFQVDGQNDNGWDQGLIFMDQAKTWFQPPYYVHQLIGAAQRSQLVEARQGFADPQVAATAFRDATGASLELVNLSDRAIPYDIDFGKASAGASAAITMIGDDRGTAVNTSQNPHNISPQISVDRLNDAGRMRYSLPPRSFSTISVGR